MKKIIVLLSAIMFIGKVNAQIAQEGNIELLKVNQPCIMATYNYSADIMEEALKKKLAEQNITNADKAKGFKVYKGILLPEISADKIDLYIKIEGKKDNSTVYILVSKGYDNFVSNARDATAYTNMKKYLDNLQANGSKVKLLQDITASQDELKRAEKRLNESVNDGANLAKEKEKLEKEIQLNKATQDARTKEMDDAKSKLDALKAQLN